MCTMFDLILREVNVLLTNTLNLKKLTPSDESCLVVWYNAVQCGHISDKHTLICIRGYNIPSIWSIIFIEGYNIPSIWSIIFIEGCNIPSIWSIIFIEGCNCCFIALSIVRWWQFVSKYGWYTENKWLASHGNVCITPAFMLCMSWLIRWFSLCSFTITNEWRQTLHYNHNSYFIRQHCGVDTCMFKVEQLGISLSATVNRGRGPEDNKKVQFWNNI